MTTTSATTVVTVTNRSIQELKNYKKQFQNFWVPFMEQFIPATTIWVAGERWCNEPCPVINLCDLDYELVEGNVSVQTITPIRPPVKPVKDQIYTTEIGTPIKPNTNFQSVKNFSEKITNTPLVTPLKDLGVTTETPISNNNNNNTNLDIQSYRNRFSSITIETI